MLGHTLFYLEKISYGTHRVVRYPGVYVERRARGLKRGEA